MSKKFYTPYDRPEKHPIITGDETLTEVDGYVSAKAQVEALLAAGQRLENFRKAQYMFEREKDVPTGYVDPTVGPAQPDMVEVQASARAVNARLKARDASMKAEADRKKAAEAAVAASGAAEKQKAV